MKTIYLHGAAKKQFGGPFVLDVATPLEAVKALNYLLPGFRALLQRADWQVIRGPQKKRRACDLDELDLRFGAVKELHLTPVAAGAGSGKGIGKIVVGVLLAAAAIALSVPTGGTSIALGATAFTVAGLGVSFGTIAALGLTIALQGAALLAQGKPKVAGYGDRESPDQRPSFLFQGPVNVAAEGATIPMSLGLEIECGSVVASAGLSTEVLPV